MFKELNVKTSAYYNENRRVKHNDKLKKKLYRVWRTDVKKTELKQ